MHPSDAHEALRWAQGKLHLIEVFREWASLGVTLTVHLAGGSITGRTLHVGTDWISIDRGTRQVYIPLRSIELACASLAETSPSGVARPSAQDGRSAMIKNQSWLGTLRAMQADRLRVAVIVRTGQQVTGRIVAVATDHIRVVDSNGDDGALGPVVPIAAITCLWLLPASQR